MTTTVDRPTKTPRQVVAAVTGALWGFAVLIDEHAEDDLDREIAEGLRRWARELIDVEKVLN